MKKPAKSMEDMAKYARLLYKAIRSHHFSNSKKPYHMLMIFPEGTLHVRYEKTKSGEVK